MLNTLMLVTLHMHDVKLAANQEGLTLFPQHWTGLYFWFSCKGWKFFIVLRGKQGKFSSPGKSANSFSTCLHIFISHGHFRKSRAHSVTLVVWTAFAEWGPIRKTDQRSKHAPLLHICPPVRREFTTTSLSWSYVAFIKNQHDALQVGTGEMNITCVLAGWLIKQILAWIIYTMVSVKDGQMCRMHYKYVNDTRRYLQPSTLKSIITLTFNFTFNIVHDSVLNSCSKKTSSIFPVSGIKEHRGRWGWRWGDWGERPDPASSSVCT